PPRVGAADARAGGRVDDDGADGAGRRAPVGPLVDLVAAPGQFRAHRRGDAALDVELARLVAVRPEGVGEALADDARLLDRLLRVHPELRDVEEYLQHRLRLPVAAGAAEGHEELAVA